MTRMPVAAWLWIAGITVSGAAAFTGPAFGGRPGAALRAARTPVAQARRTWQHAGPQMSLRQKSKAWLKEQLGDMAAMIQMSPDAAKKFDIGVSQFQEVPNATWTGTTTVEKPEADPARGVWGQPWDADLAARVRQQQALSGPQLLLDRVLAGIEDMSGSGVQPTRGDRIRGMQAAGKSTSKERLVIVGSGWGAHALVKDLDATKYDVTLVSPRNHFLFTPLLAGAATGTLETRSITESIREANPDVNYLEATVTQVHPADKKLSVQSVVCEGAECSIDDFEIEFDTLVYGVGAGVNTFGITGVKDHCYFLKQVCPRVRVRVCTHAPTTATP